MKYVRVAKITLVAAFLSMLATIANAVVCKPGQVTESFLQFNTDTQGRLGDYMRLDQEKCTDANRDAFNVPGVLGTFSTFEKATDFAIVARDLRRMCAAIGLGKKECIASLRMMYDFKEFEEDANLNTPPGTPIVIRTGDGDGGYKEPTAKRP
jgi:hypothetical protein